MIAMDTKRVAEKILNLTLETIFFLTGEDYIVVKKQREPNRESAGTCIAEGPCPVRNPLPKPPPNSHIHDGNILALTHTIVHLLTGEVLNRCKDVSFGLSVEEQEQQHRMESRQNPLPLGRDTLNPEITRNERIPEIVRDYTDPPERRLLPAPPAGESGDKISPLTTPGDLYVQEPLGEENRVTQEYQVKQEDETFSLQCNYKEIIPTQIGTGGAASWGIPRGEHCSASEFPIVNDQSANVFSENSATGRTSEPVRLTNNNYSFHEELRFPEPPRHPLGTEYSPLLFNVQEADYAQKRPESGGRAREKPYVCSKCGKGFAHKSTLIKHQSFHMGDFTCSQCGKRFNWKSNLLVHERSHAGQKPFTCSECGKCFAHKSTLVKHQLFHMGAFTCSECGKGFSQKSNLLAHQRRHTGHKPYSCFECGRSFSQNSSLVTHQRIHTGEKPFSCSECGKCYTQHASLLVHHRTHTGEKPYVCSDCGKAFNQMAHLVKHQRSHKH
uniref:Zinc finger protein 343 n=1 Tax=Xenopus tropicalis TaxID=8364 RepID=A0A6I8RRJ6_XENTR